MEYRDLGSQKLTNPRRLSQTCRRYDSTERHDRDYLKHATSDKRHTRFVTSCDLSGSNTNSNTSRFQQHAYHRNAKDMNFGYNTNVNKVVRKITEKPKKQLQTDRPTEHLESFDTNEIPKKYSEKHQRYISETQRGVKTAPPLRESNLTIFIVSGVLVYGLTKMILYICYLPVARSG